MSGAARIFAFTVVRIAPTVPVARRVRFGKNAKADASQATRARLLKPRSAAYTAAVCWDWE